MRHKKTVAKLSLKSGPRKALLRTLVTSFVLKGKLRTTLAKAKAARSLVERHITAAGKGTLAAERRLGGYYYDKRAVKSLMKDLGPKYKERNGGYTRMIKLDSRKGDNAEMAILEFV